MDTLNQSIHLWSRGESNPCPNKFAVSFLHAYFTIICRDYNGSEPTSVNLSWMELKLTAQPKLIATCICFESAAEHGNRSTCSAALMTT